MENNSEIEVVQANDLSYNVVEISEDENLCGNVVISIEDMLKRVHPINGKSSIYRVSKLLRETNPKAYAPQVISIGPFHHQCLIGGNFKATEHYKLQALINFLRRINNKMKYSSDEEDVEECTSLEDILETGSLKDLVKKVHSWMKKARNCYREPIEMDDHKFLIMMLVDACFIVEFFILEYDSNSQIEDVVGLSLLYQNIRIDIFHDLMKLENQVPFFLLQRLYNLLPRDGNPMFFIELIESFAKINWSLENRYQNPFSHWKPKHLVDFLSFYFRPLPLSPDDKPLDDKQNKLHEKNMNKCLSFLCVLFPAYRQKQHEENSCEKNNNRKPGAIIDEEDPSAPSITELCEAGVIIKKAKEFKYLMDINFKNGVLEIPPIHIYDDFELLLRNMIAFDQFQPKKYAVHYVSFLDDLISTEKDVRLLVKARVIINKIGGSDKEISDMFNNICKFVTLSTYSDRLEDITNDLREHCNGRWNKAKASLKHNYFNTPWAGISVFAATFIIVLTLLQTIFSIISTFSSKTYPNM